MIVDAEKRRQIHSRVAFGDPLHHTCRRVIRKLRIDEFPQIINVLKGDMSIVGPRRAASNTWKNTKRNKVFLPPARQKAA